MPNWCYNNMTVHGKTDDLRKLVKAISVSETNDKGDTHIRQSLASLYPVPSELMEYNSPLSRKDADGKIIPLTDEEKEQLQRRFMVQYGASDWYNWCTTFWGTKWGDCETTINSGETTGDNGEVVIPDGETYVAIYYETAWSPADGLIAKISELFPNLLFGVVSTEEADLFACWSVFHKGNIVGQGSLDTEADLPKEIADLADNEETMDDYYEQVSEWQCERNSKLDDEQDKFIDKYLSNLKAMRDKTEYEYKLRMVRLMDEREKALAEFALAEVIK